MTRYMTTVTIRHEAAEDADLEALDERITAAVWGVVAPFVADGTLDEVSHVDTETDEEDA